MAGGNRIPLEDNLPIFAADFPENEKSIYVIEDNYEEIFSVKAEPTLADITPLSEEKMILEEANDSCCITEAAQVSHFYYKFTVD